jgi:glutamyl/glutaminyl-tRNA synthetase
LWRDSFATTERAWLLRVIELLNPRLKKLNQIVDDGALFLAGNIRYDEAAVAKHLATAGTRGHLDALRSTLASAQPFDQVTIETALRALASERGIKAASLIHAMRVAVTGRSVSPGLFEVVELVGRDRTLTRLAAAMDLAST